MVLLGAAAAARLAASPDPGSTSFLAVGLLAVVALLFLVDVLFEWWMIIVIPVRRRADLRALALGHHERSSSPPRTDPSETS